MNKPKMPIKLLLTFIGVLSPMFLIILNSTVVAQVNVNSKSSESDSGYYELLEADTVLEETTIINLPDTGGDNVIQQLVSNLENDIINNKNTPEFVKNVVKTLGLPTTTATLTSLAFVPSIISLLPLIFSPNFLPLLLAAIFKEKKNIWGLVYDQKTRKPVPFAVVRLFESGSNALKDQKVTDLQGRYGFVLSTGNYRLEVSHSDFAKFIKEVEIAHKEEIFAEDVPLVESKQMALASMPKKIFNSIKKFTLKYSLIFALIGLFASIIALFITNNFINGVIFFIYLFIIAFYVYVKTRDNRNWGIVEDATNGLAINGATVRLFDKKNNLADTKITDEKGRFGFLVDPGQYSLLVNAYGYKFPSKSQENLGVDKDNPTLLDLDIQKTNCLNLVIKLDNTELPEASLQTQANLLSPFAT